MRNAVVFIDGENLRYSLQGFAHEDFSEHEHLFGSREYPFLEESDVNWTSFLKHIVPEGYRMVRAYWYKAGKLSDWFRPSEEKEYIARRWVAKYLKCTEEELTEETIWKEIDRAERWYKNKRNWYDSVLRSHMRIMLNMDDIEFRYQGFLTVDPLGERIIREKGVDLALAVDMVTMIDGYELAILVTGDVDYTPAVEYVKNRLRKVLQVAVGPRIPPFIGKAAKLRQIVDEVLPVFGDEIIPRMLRRADDTSGANPPNSN